MNWRGKQKAIAIVGEREEQLKRITKTNRHDKSHAGCDYRSHLILRRDNLHRNFAWKQVTWQEYTMTQNKLSPFIWMCTFDRRQIDLNSRLFFVNSSIFSLGNITTWYAVWLRQDVLGG